MPSPVLLASRALLGAAATLLYTGAARPASAAADAPVPSASPAPAPPAAAAGSRVSWLLGWRANPAESAAAASAADGGAGRLALLLVGATGAGKSSTGNTLCGRQADKFKSAAAASGVTAAAAHRDYAIAQPRWRVIDPPGLGAAPRPPAAVAAELRAAAALAPAGALVVLVVPHGRVTAAQAAALDELRALFGAGLPAAAIVAVTHATADDASRALLSREALLEDVATLPMAHGLRAFVEAAGRRVVAVDNRMEPHRTVSRLSLHQAALQLLEERGGRTFDLAAAADAAAAAAAAAETQTGGEQWRGTQAGGAQAALGLDLELAHAVVHIERAPGSRRVRLVVEGEQAR